MKLLEELLVTIFQMSLRNLLLSLFRTLIKILQELTLSQEILNTGEKHLAVEWFGNIGICSMLITLCAMLLQVLRRKHNNRDMRGSRIRLQLFSKLQSVHNRHHHIANHQVRHLFQGDSQTLFTIGGLKNNILILQKSTLILTDIGIIINNQNCRAIGILAYQLLNFSTTSVSIVNILQNRFIYNILTS